MEIDLYKQEDEAVHKRILNRHIDYQTIKQFAPNVTIVKFSNKPIAKQKSFSKLTPDFVSLLTEMKPSL
ncbi:hypothetical protein BTR40_06700 [Vibrio parahaemolyticus]|nr:hypothetical protein BTR40_06700 [Vibrio parahaemolyticus]